MPSILIENLSKRYRLGETHEQSLSENLATAFGRAVGRTRRGKRAAEEFWALRDVSLSIDEGEAVGVIGSNGAGKSTLLKVLSRITPPTSGRALVRGRLSSLLEVGTGFHPELTGRENVFLNGTILGMRKLEVVRKFDEIVSFAGVEKFIDTPVKRYSSGMYVRLAFAVAAHLEPDVLIIDEVLAVGDAEFQKRCLGKMSDVTREGRTVLFVSHNMAAITKLCARAVWIRDGRVAMVGESGSVVDAYQGALQDSLDGGVGRPPGLIFHKPPDGSDGVVSISLIADGEEVLAEAATMEPVRIRVDFEIASPQQGFFLELKVSTMDGTCLILTSTMIDGNAGHFLHAGQHHVECRFERLPLSAGDYVIGIAFGISRVEYLWKSEGLCMLSVAPRDVYGSGRPPASGKYLVVTDHRWTLPGAAWRPVGEARPR